mgnify:FL=1|jgi:hypothetical protein
MDDFRFSVSQALRAHALGFPEVSEGTSCVNRAFKVRKKNFVFIGEKEASVRVMVRLSESAAAAAQMGDARIGIGRTGWATLNFPPDDPPDLAMMRTWIDESFRTLAPKTVLKAWLTEG